MLALDELTGRDLHRAEVLQADHGDARVGLVADEDEVAVVVALGLAERGVVHVAPIHVAAGRCLGAIPCPRTFFDASSKP